VGKVQEAPDNAGAHELQAKKYILKRQFSQAFLADAQLSLAALPQNNKHY